MNSLIKKNVSQIIAYVPGKPIEEVKREYGLRKILKLASNENCLGPSPKAIKAIREKLFNISRYPDGACYYLKKALSNFFSLKEDNFVLGNGSDELIDIIIKTFLKDGEEVLSANTTFLEYEIITKVNNGIFKSVPLVNFKYDLDSIKNKITKNTKIIFIANPNNPTGTYINEKESVKFLKGIPKNIVVVFDEAYFEFVDEKDYFNSLKWINKYNIIVLRTFSKAYGLAGLRLGFSISNPVFAQFMNQVRQPFNINYLAQIGGVAALKDKAFLERIKQLIWKEKRFIYNNLDELKINYIPSAANFILINIKDNGLKLTKEMLKEGVIVRDMQQYGLSNFIRLTIGTRKENIAFLEIFRDKLKQVNKQK
jgi:histidinol-phosphate aminotransferase